MLRVVAVILALLGPAISTAAAQEAPRGSECLAMAQVPPRAKPVSLRRLAAKVEEVTITYAGHSTYYIDTPGGVRIATDFSGAYTTGRLPDVVSMNRAHSTHYTLFPDPRIPHVLHGWGDDGKPARINERIGDVLIRNVTTDIRRYFMDDSSGEDDQRRGVERRLERGIASDDSVGRYVQQRGKNQQADDGGAAASAPPGRHHRKPFAPSQPDFVPGKPGQCGCRHAAAASQSTSAMNMSSRLVSFFPFC